MKAGNPKTMKENDSGDLDFYCVLNMNHLLYKQQNMWIQTPN